MDLQSHLILSKKLLEKCGRDSSASIYSLVPLIDHKPEYLKGLFGHSLENVPKMIDGSVKVFMNKKMKNGFIIERLKEEEKNFRTVLNRSLLKADINKISENKEEVMLSLISHVYFDCFARNVMFFLPHSASCSGHFEFFEEIDYLKLREYFSGNTLEFQKRVLDSEIWDKKFKLDDFKPVIQKRLKKENLIDKELDCLGLVKAMIIRIGELGNPSINYEVIDYALRNFFRQMNVNKYLRVDREIEFLRKLEEEVKDVLKELIQ